MDWNDRTRVKKGNIGEGIVKNILEKRGYIIYKCITNTAHAFDFLAVKNKRTFVIAEVKSKARLNKIEATGIDLKHFNEYKYIYMNQNIDVVLFFVDEHPKEERIYCQKLSILMKPKVIKNINYPNYDFIKGIVLFSLSDMVTICHLNKEKLSELRNYSTRNYRYK